MSDEMILDSDPDYESVMLFLHVLQSMADHQLERITFNQLSHIGLDLKVQKLLDDGLLRTENDNQSVYLVPNLELPIVQAIQYLVKWIPTAVYNLQQQSERQIALAYRLSRRMHLNQHYRQWGVAHNYTNANRWLNILHEAEVIVLQRCRHPSSNGRTQQVVFLPQQVSPVLEKIGESLLAQREGLVNSSTYQSVPSKKMDW